MLDERFRRVRKRSFAKVRPRLLSENSNEHNDLTVTEALNKFIEKRTIEFFQSHPYSILLVINREYNHGIPYFRENNCKHQPCRRQKGHKSTG